MSRQFLVLLIVLAVLTVAVVGGAVLWLTPAARDDLQLLAAGQQPAVAVDAAMELRIQRFCGDCHAVPRPDSFPRDAWHDEVTRGYEFYTRSGRTDLDRPPFPQTLAYFRSRAPQQLGFPEPPSVAKAPPIPWQAEPWKFAQEPSAVAPAVAYLRWTVLSPGAARQLLLCDMRQGNILSVDFHHPARPVQQLAQLNNPCHLEPCDLDSDGSVDLVIADLGSFFPADHSLGRVVWLHRSDEAASWEATVLAEQLGRVADVRPADVDADGDVDLIVAEFGNERTGGIHLLRNQRAGQGATEFTLERLDPRPGTIHVPVTDWNHDGRPDFAALISQEQEQIDLFLNQGSGRFTRQVLWSALDPTFAVSGMELIDLDQDGDTDILFTNGDAFDNSYLNPAHGIQWLEQRDGLEFVRHRIADLPGAYRALAGDLDRDGDLDIVASTWLPPQIRPHNVDRATLASLIYLEQVAPGEFQRFALEAGSPYHAALELADLDGDNDLDIVAGQHWLSGRVRNVQGESHSATIWWNRLERAR